MLYLLPVYRERERAAGAAKGAICRVKCFSLVPRAASPAYGELDFGPSRGPPPSPARPRAVEGAALRVCSLRGPGGES